jgi:hypothetical protein
MREPELADRERQLVSDARERDAEIALKQSQQEKRLAEKERRVTDTFSQLENQKREGARRNRWKISGKSGYRLCQTTTTRHRPLLPYNA